MKLAARDQNYFYCRHCAWRTLKWAKLKNGKVASGWVRLEEHLLIEHDIDATLLSSRDDKILAPSRRAG